MSVKEIQEAVRRMPAAKRRKLTTWMVTQYPAFTVEGLVAKAERRIEAGSWRPSPPTAASVPTGPVLARAKLTAKRLGLAK